MKKALLYSFVLMLALVTQAWAQTRTVTGRVTDAQTGEGMPGVTVQLKGSTTAAPTDVNGSYSINVPSAGGSLIFSFIGYTNQEVSIGDRANVNVTLRSDAELLNEVVVQVPYGTVAKTAFTGAESTVSTQQIQRQQVTNVSRALEGLVPGLQVTNGGGRPGTETAMIVRGVGSVNASQNPLIIVDGVAYDGALSSISNDDIASVTVLKDASASALYGARAANGVLMVTTKRGVAGKPKLGISLRTGQSERAIEEYDRVGSAEYYELMYEGLKNRYIAAGNIANPAVEAANKLIPSFLIYNNTNVADNQIIDPTTGKFNPNAKLLYEENWSDALFRTGSRHDLNLNVSGGAEKTSYFLSLGYLSEEGIAKFSGYDRFNGRLKVDSEVTKWLNAGINLSGAMSNSSGNFATGTATSNPFYYSRYMGPIFPVYLRDKEGNIVKDPITGGDKLDWGTTVANGGRGTRPYAGNSNLLGSLDLDENTTDRTEAIANTYLEAKFLKDFSFRTTLGANYYDALTTGYQNSQFGDAANVTGRSTKSTIRQLSYTFNQVLSWNKRFGDHGLSALAGHENYFLDVDETSATRTGFPFPGHDDLVSAATAGASSSYSNFHRLEGYFTQVSYNFLEKYLLSGSFRRDGSSRFAPESRWGNFWSVGAGWRLSQESFLSYDWLDELKLRASYGEQGNENLGTGNNYYAYRGLYDFSWNNGSRPGVLVASWENRDLQWETNANFNIGLDFQLFRKLQGTLELYERKSDNLLFFVPFAPSTGLDGRNENVGAMRNRGVELQLGYNAIRTTNFDWRIDVNLAHYKNEITKLSQPEIIDGTKKMVVGRDRYAFWLREYAGVNPANGDALYYKDVLDTNGNSTGERTTTNNINQASYYWAGSSIPDLYGGVTNSFRFKNFELSALVTYQLGGKFYDSNYAGLMHRGAFGTAFHTDIRDRWQKPGDITDVPRLQNSVAAQEGVSTRFLFDASYLNVKNINFAYVLPQSLIGKVGANNVRAFVSLENAFILTAKEGMDPQRAFNGTSDYTYPVNRTLTLGLNLNF